MYNVSADFISQASEAVQSYKIIGTIGDVSITEANILDGSLSITNKCTNKDVALGSVCVGTMKVTFLHNVNINRFAWKGKEIKLSIGLKVGNSYEDVPIAPYIVQNAKYTAAGMVITAYDNMTKFDRPFGIDTISGKLFDLLTYACTNCGVELGLTQEECEALPNGDWVLYFDEKTGIQTYRDFISWVAVTIGGFATIDRDGKLIVRVWQSTPVMTYTSPNRYKGAEYEAYVTLYDGVYLTTKNGTEFYGQTNGSTLVLGQDPFIQMESQESREFLIDPILDSIANISYMPCKFNVAVGMHLDLGDVVTISGGLVDEPINICVMEYTFNYNKSYTIRSYGEDPTAKASSKTDKALAGYAQSATSKEWRIKTFTNAQAIDVNDHSRVLLLSMGIVSVDVANLLFLAEILEQLTLTSGQTEALITIDYELNGDSIVYMPKQIYHLDGKHLLHLHYPIALPAGRISRFNVYMTIDGGSVHINAGEIQATISGTGLAAQETWDGTIHAKDELDPIVIPITAIKTITDNAIVALLAPMQVNISDNVSAIPVDAVEIATITDALELDAVVKNAYVDESTASEMSYSTTYVEIVNHNFVLRQTYMSTSISQAIDSGYCTKITPMITGLATIESVTIQ